MKSSMLTLFIAIGSLVGEKSPINEYLEKIKIGKPVEYRNLKIFPILLTKQTAQIYITLDEAMSRGWLKIRESGSGEVNFVELKNDGKEVIFIMTGEIITGAKQDRMLKEDLLIPPKSKWIKVPVYCVEQGRWVAVSKEFRSENLLAPNAIRQKAKISESQTAVWSEIRKKQEEMGIFSETQTVRANYEDERIKKELAKYTQKFKNIPKLSKFTVGVVATTGERIICFDMFSNNALFEKLWEKLIKSYVMDALSEKKSSVNRKDVKEFVESIKKAKTIPIETPGLGKLAKIETESGKGGALLYKNAIVHLDFFPKTSSPDEEPGLRLDIRREERLRE